MRQILSDKRQSKTYTDADLTPDLFRGPPAELVRSWNFVGDTRGRDIGNASAEVVLNPIEIEIEERPKRVRAI